VRNIFNKSARSVYRGNSLTRIACSLCSILGMTLFGGKFCVTKDQHQRQCNCDEISSEADLCRCERKNFDSLLWAIVTVFQVRFYCALCTVLSVCLKSVMLWEC